MDYESSFFQTYQNTNHDQKDSRHVPVFDKSNDEHEHQKVDSRGDSIQGIRTKTLKDGTRGFDTIDNGRKSGSQ